VDGSLASRIREARERAGLSQEEFAGRLGVSLRTIGNWERGATVPQARVGALRELLDELEGGAPLADEPPVNFVTIAEGGLVIRIQPAPGMTVEDVAADRAEFIRVALETLERLRQQRQSKD
jgi:transcriptional regulator with XRE-family HTH domain